MSTRVDAARADYEEQGYLTTPLRPRGKAPFARDWQRGAGWSAAPPDANIGIITGAPSRGLAVLDFDELDAFRRAFPQGVRQLARTTPVVRTARGLHVWTHAPSVASCKLAPNIDLKADGGLIVAPPSVHATGHAYAFVGPARDPAELARLPLRLAKPRPEIAKPTVAPARSEAAVSASPDVHEVSKWMENQSVQLRAHWRALVIGGGQDRSRAEVVIAIALLERGLAATEVARVLRLLPGGKARERDEEYAARTVARAAEVIRIRDRSRYS